MRFLGYCPSHQRRWNLPESSLCRNMICRVAPPKFHGSGGQNPTSLRRCMLRWSKQTNPSGQVRCLGLCASLGILDLGTRAAHVFFWFRSTLGFCCEGPLFFFDIHSKLPYQGRCPKRTRDGSIGHPACSLWVATTRVASFSSNPRNCRI